MEEEPNEGKLAFYKGRQAPNEPAVPSGTASYRSGVHYITKPEGTSAHTTLRQRKAKKKAPRWVNNPPRFFGKAGAEHRNSRVRSRSEHSQLPDWGGLQGPWMPVQQPYSRSLLGGSPWTPSQVEGRADTTAAIPRTGRGPTAEAYHYPGCFLRPSAHLTRGPSAQCRHYHAHATIADSGLGGWCRCLLPLGARWCQLTGSNLQAKAHPPRHASPLDQSAN